MKKGPFKMKGPGVKAADKISKKPASAGRKATKAFSNVAKGFSSKAKSVISQLTKSAKNTFVNNAVSGAKQIANSKNAARKQRKATGKIGRKVAGKLGGKLLGPVGAALAIKDAVGTVKDIRKGMKPGKAARKNFLGF